MSCPPRLLLLLATLPLLAFLPACLDSSSGSEFVREVGLNVAGLYQGADGAKLVSQNSGSEITQMNIMQSGSRITGVDNNGNIYRGNINQVSGETAGFTMKGLNSAGAEATISGRFNVSGDTSSVSGRWIEPTVLASINGSSFVPGRSDDDDGDDGDTGDDTPIAVSPSGNQTLAVGEDQQFAVSGGDGANYTWTLDNSGIGTLNRSSGSSVTYSASGVGSQTITIQSGGESASISISQSGAQASALTVAPTGNRSFEVPSSVAYTASGGDGDYRWSLSNDSIGTLSGTTGASVTYLGTAAGTQTITIESDGQTVTRRVNQSAAGAAALAVSPSSLAVLNSGDSQVFTASGGTAPYLWSLSDGNLGALSATEGSTVTYSATGVGAQVLTLTDDAGGSVSVAIGQITGGGGTFPPPIP